MTFQRVEELAMKLTDAERERLAAHLLASIGNAADSPSSQEWIDEAEQRLDELLEGRVKAIDGNAFFDIVERDLGWK